MFSNDCLQTYHDEIRQRVDPEGGVVVPVDGAGVEGERGEVSLGHDRLDEVGGDVARVGEVDAVAAHLGHDVLAEQDDLLEEEGQWEMSSYFHVHVFLLKG